MAKVTMTLTGMEALQRALKEAPDQVKLLASDAVSKTAFAVAQRARRLVPVGATGRLKAAITSSSTTTNGRVGLAAGGAGKGKVGPEVYWRFVEFGTRYAPARPFMRPAADAEADDYVARIRAIGPRLERDLATSRFT